MEVQDYAAVIKEICVAFQISIPDTNLIRNATQYCKQLNHLQLRKRFPVDSERFAFIARSYVESINDQKQEFDYTEYLHAQHKSDESLSQKLAALSTSWVNEQMPVIASKAMTIYIDSSWRDRSSNSKSITDFAFQLVPRQSQGGAIAGQIQTRVMPSQITYFKIGKFKLPYAASMRQTNYSKELTLTFTALRSNGILSQNETFHFTFTYNEINDGLVEVSPLNEYCKFSPPLRLLDDLTLRFNDPIYSVAFPGDTLMPSQFNYITDDGRISFGSPHGLNTGDVIIVMGLTANGTSAINVSILESVNDPRGHVITKISDWMISIGVDISDLVSPDNTALPSIRVLSRTFRFPLEIGYQDVIELK